MKYCLSQIIVLCYEVFERNDIIDTTAAHCFSNVFRLTIQRTT